MNPDRPPQPPTNPSAENRESNEGEPLTIQVYAEDVRATFQDEAGVRRTEDKTWYRWEGQLWEKKQGEYTPGNVSYKQESNLEALAQNLRAVSDAKSIPERKQQNLPSYKIALYPHEEVKRNREEQLKAADNVISATIRALTTEESTRFRQEYSGTSKKTPTPTLAPTRVEQTREKISSELRKRLEEAAEAAHMPREKAPMTETLRQLLDEVRTTYPIYLFNRFASEESPYGFEEYQTIGNKKALENAGGDPRKVLLHQATTRVNLEGKYNDNKRIENVILTPLNDAGTRTLLYNCYDEEIRGSTGDSRHPHLKAWSTLPADKAAMIFAELQQNPQYARQFFIAATLDIPASQYIWKKDPRRRPRSASERMNYINESENDITVTAREKIQDVWQPTVLPDKARKHLEAVQAEIRARYKRAQEEKLRPPEPEKKSVWQKFKDWL